MKELCQSYIAKLTNALNLGAMEKVPMLGEALRVAWSNGNCVFICGNGGSAGNAIHLANDFIYGAGLGNDGGLQAEALSANAAIITCLANDLGYEFVYAQQLKVKARQDDVLIVLSGSGNSLNVINALETGNAIGMNTFAILGYSGGRCKHLAQHSIHFEIDDMQIAEDLQLIVGHMCMQWLSKQKLFVT